MVKVKLLGNAKKVIGNSIININARSIDDVVSILRNKGIDINELLILVNGVELSLADKRLSDDDVVTVASIVHGG